MKLPTVFVASSPEGAHFARELRHHLGAEAEVTLWCEGAFHPGQTPIESLSDVSARCDFAVFLLTRDDLTATRGGSPQPRANLIFELGFITARLGSSRTFVLVESGELNLNIPTDIAGIECIPFSRRDTDPGQAAIAPAVALIQRALRAMPPRSDSATSFYSCFISYSWRDKDFVTRLHADLEEVGVRCWLDAKDLKVGESISQQIGKAIQQQDKVLLILSHQSVRSTWVRAEVKNILLREQERRGTVLFPLRLDNDVLDTELAPTLSILRDRHILDFTEWHDTGSYRRAFRRLVRDLSVSASVDSEGSP